MSEIKRGRRHHGVVRGGVAALALAAAGCSGSGQLPTVNLGTPNGPVPVLDLGRAGTPPAGAPAVPPAAVAAGDLSGVYGGWASVLQNPGQGCQNQIRIINFRVNGQQVRFGAFSGTVRADGALRMVFGQDWITGQFVVGPRFQGRLQNRDFCVWSISLDRGA
jgi:hypothetical protein